MSEANRGDIAFNEETVFNETPSTPAMQELRFSDEGINHNSETVEDDELRDDRAVQDLIEVGVSADGDLNGGLYFANADKFIAAALCSTFGAFSGVTVDKVNLQIVNATTKIVRASGSWVADGFQVNQFVRTRGFSTAANNGLWKVSAVTATDLTIAGTGTLVDEASASGRIVQGLFGTSNLAGVTAGTTIGAAAVGAGTGQFTRSAGSFITDGFVVGQRIRTFGFTNGANNGIFEITAVAAGALDVSGATVVTEGTAAGRAIMGDHIRNGVTKRSFHIEKRFLDIGKYISYRGMRVGKMMFDLESRALAKLGFTLLGAKGVSADSSLAASTTPANKNKRYVAGPNVAVLKEGGSALTQACLALSFEVENGLEGVATIDSKEFDDVSLGTCVVKGTMRLYFADRVHYAKFEAQTESSLEYQINDIDGNTYYFKFPRIKYSVVRANLGGKNQRVIADCSWQALHSDTFAAQIIIDRIPV